MYLFRFRAYMRIRTKRSNGTQEFQGGRCDSPSVDCVTVEEHMSILTQGHMSSTFSFFLPPLFPFGKGTIRANGFIRRPRLCSIDTSPQSPHPHQLPSERQVSSLYSHTQQARDRRGVDQPTCHHEDMPTPPS